MAAPSRIKWERVTGRLGDVAYQVTRVHFANLVPPRWQPAINAYRCREGFAVCVDLAGVDKESIQIEVEPRRLRIRGFRASPEPDRKTHEAVQVLVMEIDCGEFEREIAFPADIDATSTNAEQRNGLLWIFLPLKTGA